MSKNILQKNKIPIAKPSLPSLEAYTDKLRRVWETRMLSNFAGFAEDMEKEICQYLKTDNVSVVSSGDVGLMIGLSILDLPEGGEVIVPSFTFNSTINAVLWNGLVPVFADIEKETLNIDPVDVEKKIGEKTCVILATHVFGSPCEVGALRNIADDYDLRLVFDAAHGYGAEYQGRKVGLLGDVEVFSFSGTKVVTSAEGGAVVTRSGSDTEKIRYARNYGYLEDYQSKMIGLNGKISELEAALGVLTLPEVDECIEKREKVVDWYKSGLQGVGDIRFQKIEDGNKSAHKDFYIITFQREALKLYLEKEGVGVKKYFHPCHLMPHFSKYRCNLPVTEEMSRQVLCIPLFNEISSDEVSRVISLIKSFYG